MVVGVNNSGIIGLDARLQIGAALAIATILVTTSLQPLDDIIHVDILCPGTCHETSSISHLIPLKSLARRRLKLLV